MKKSVYLILLITAFSTTLGLGIISPFLLIFAEKQGANGFWMGMIFAGFGASRGIIMPIVGKLSDKRGRKIFITSGLFLFTVISLFYSNTESLTQLMIVRMIHGFATGMIMPIVMAYICDMAEGEHAGLRTGTMNMMFYLGLAAGPIWGGFLNHHFGFNSIFHAMSILGGITFLMTLFFLPNQDKAAAKTKVHVEPFKNLIEYNFVKAVLIIVTVLTLMLVVFLSFLPSLAEEKIHLDPFHIGIIISLGIFVAGILQVPFGWISDKWDMTGKLIQISFGTCIGMLSLFMIPLCPNFTALAVAGILMGLGAAVSMPPLTSAAIDIGHQAGMGAWMGIFSAARSLAFAVTPILCGLIMDYLGIDSVFYLFGILCVVGTISFLHYARLRLKGVLT